MHQPKQSSASRYQTVRKIGQSTNRVTYLAKDNETGQPVAIKQFFFGKDNPDWAGAKAYGSDCKTLRYLGHPRLPKYLNFFPTPDGFCAVREYKTARRPLSTLKNLNLKQWRKVALSLLDTLIYLQSQTPRIFHRNIKPENVLVNKRCNADLVDFGFPFINHQGKANEATAGTPGFMPREQLRNKELTDATDLYGLGATLVCLLTQTPSGEISRILGADSDFDLQSVLPKEASYELVEWLETMTQISPVRRYKNASEALEVLQSIEIVRLPDAIVQPQTLVLQASEYGEILRTTLTIRNTVPHTLLQGHWSVSPSSSKQSKKLPQWISFEPEQFESNEIECQIAIDTSKLLPDQTYNRDIILRANDRARKHPIALKILTPSLLSVKLPLIPIFGTLGVAFLGGCLGGALFAGFGSGLTSLPLVSVIFWFGLGIGAIGSLGGIFNIWSALGGSFPISLGAMRFFPGRRVIGLGFSVGLIVFGIAGYVARYCFGRELPSGLSGLLSLNVLLLSLTAMFGISLGLLATGGMTNLIVLLSTGIPLGVLLTLQSIKQGQRIARYKSVKPHLVKP
ncbi:protein kinase domain-containing protein [Lusitaniella coriacea]|uniref:serine/threonine protein kinase n=1 Tax=Lusitaniella coriacea TaxID=1983105 RepID=UPI003CF72918